MHRIDTKTAQKDKFGAGRTVLPVVTPRPARLPPIWMMTTLTCCRRNFAAWWRHPVPAWRRGGTTSYLPHFALLLSRKNPFGDIKSDGTVQTALENLGLGEGSALPVGVPVPWPSATPPTGWLKCNGAAFSAEEYPNWQRLIRQINCLIYVVSLFVAGMTGAVLMQDVFY